MSREGAGDTKAHDATPSDWTRLGRAGRPNRGKLLLSERGDPPFLPAETGERPQKGGYGHDCSSDAQAQERHTERRGGRPS